MKSPLCSDSANALKLQMDNAKCKGSLRAINLISLKAENLDIFLWPSQSPGLNPTEFAFQLLKMNLKAERPINNLGLAKHLKGGHRRIGGFPVFRQLLTSKP